MALREQANVPGSLERAVAMAVTRDQKLAVQKVTKVLAMYSLVPEAKKAHVRMHRHVKVVDEDHRHAQLQSSQAR
eukprot:CAMPEP_0196180210 /NCGR_PEP_ID=MMETSP0911-20130528/23436_1 /TAXON_ID=49265 /ORGANISM="Thalassiosira rotula, Strain GSO102" /LENGTH=74 /DNA_ID=CAMNT_0041449239 /DNA_START=24 /DNA_END=245 /DNA_ORIENTATION=+